jgi:hypothetical protein
MSLCVAVAPLLLSPAPALAHPGGVQAAVDYRVRVTALTPPVAGLAVRFVFDGSRLELRNDTGRTVEVIGYQGEPMLQVRPDGVWHNTRAPSLYADRPAAAGPAGADVNAAPDWRRVSTTPVARWQDHRTLWHGRLPPQVDADPGREHRLRDWQVPLRIDQTGAVVTGTLDWVPNPATDAWWLAAVALAAAIAVLGLVRPTASPRRLHRSRMGLAAAGLATAAAAIGYPLLVVAANAEPGSGPLALAVLSQLLPFLGGLALIAGAAATLAGRSGGTFLLTFAALALLTFYGLSNAVVFAHGVAPIAADAIVARVAELLILGGCGGLLAAGVLAMVRTARTPAPQPANTDTARTTADGQSLQP